eukprot:gene8478-10419_t
MKVIIPTKFKKDVVEGFESDENDVDSAGVTKTNRSISYTFSNDKYSITVSDSPGINDTREGRDQKNIEDIIQSFINIPLLTCLVLVISGTNPRLTTEVKNSLKRIIESIPDSLVDNVVVLITKCSEDNVNLKIDELGLGKMIKPDMKNVFYIDNPFFSSDQSLWSEKTKISLNKEWKYCMETLDEFLSYVSSVKPVSTCDFKLVSDKKSDVFNSFNLFYQLLSQVDTINLEQEKIRNAADSQSMNEELILIN